MTTEIATNTDTKQQQVTSDNNNNNSKHSTNGHDDTSQQQQQQQQLTVSEAGLAHGLSKYPLENSWSFWFFKNDQKKDWKDNLVFITTVDFVEDFWALVASFFAEESI